MMDAETRFLQNQQARLASLHQSSSSYSRRREELHRFQSALRQRLDEWKTRVRNSLEPFSSSSQSLLSNENIKEIVRDLQEELDGIRQHTLQSTTSTNPSSYGLPEPPADVPLTDIRLWHESFTEHQSYLNQNIQQLRPHQHPYASFTFRRYRQAYQEQQSRREQLASSDVNVNVRPPSQDDTTTTSAVEKGADAVVPNDNTLQNLKGAHIVIGAQGTTVSIDSEIQQQVSSQVLLISNVTQCAIEVNTTLPSLHLIQLLDCTLQIRQAVTGPIHVTQCHQSTFQQLAAQQLRIHESNDLTIHNPLGIHAGIIMENCRAVRFIVPREEQRDDVLSLVKDFCWLRSDRASPNFSIDVISMLPPPDNERSVELLSSCVEANQTTDMHSFAADTITNGSAHNSYQNTTEDEEDDDEL